jgi:phthalate 4,5-dioxygenase oxygenase subunit
LEGDIDTSHFSFLHTGKVELDDIDPDHLERFQLIGRAPRYHARTTDWGTMYAVYRPAQPGYLYYRFVHFAMPFWTLFPNGPLIDNILAQAWVPLDDTHTMAFAFTWKHKTLCSASPRRESRCRFSTEPLRQYQMPRIGSVAGVRSPIRTMIT